VFYIANHPLSEGGFISDDFRVTQEQKKELEGLNSVERSRRFYQYGWEEIKSNPKRIARLIFLKNRRMWLERYSKYDFYGLLPHSRIPLVKFRLIFLLAVLGFIYLIHMRRIWSFFLILGYLGSYLFLLSTSYFYHGPRNRIEVVTILCILGALGFVQFAHSLSVAVRDMIEQLKGGE